VQLPNIEVTLKLVGPWIFKQEHISQSLILLQGGITHAQAPTYPRTTLTTKAVEASKSSRIKNNPARQNHRIRYNIQDKDKKHD